MSDQDIANSQAASVGGLVVAAMGNTSSGPIDWNKQKVIENGLVTGVGISNAIAAVAGAFSAAGPAGFAVAMGVENNAASMGEGYGQCS
jgi:hypothetical protein